MNTIWLFIKRLFGIKDTPKVSGGIKRADLPGDTEPPVEDKGDGFIGPRPNDR